MKAYLSFFAALIIDFSIIPLVGFVWLPYFSLAVLPAVMLYTSRKTSRTIAGIEIVFLWLTTGINLGIVVLGIGLFVLFQEWFIGRFFRVAAWQTLIISALGLLVPGILFIVLSRALTPFLFIVYSTVSIRFGITVLTAIFVSYAVKKSIK